MNVLRITILRLCLSASLLSAAATGAALADPASPGATGPATNAAGHLTCPGAPAGPDLVCMPQGAVRGTVDGNTLAFRGIPYALPPVGALRWKPPVPAKSWAGVRKALQYGASCPQLNGKTVEGDEDCLYVNVWRPLAAPVKPLPVMIWLTGGGNHSYSGAGSTGFGKVVYNGRALIGKEGAGEVIVVTYNLRLGVLGFLAHPALDAERPEHVSGNYGSLDQVAMLEWVQRNIGAFGGDPKRVFLFGTSAGGGNICALMSSPLTRGLFHGAAMQSSVPAGCEIQTLADAENGTGRTVAASLGCEGQADVAACLRAQPLATLVGAVPGTFTVFPRVYGPNMDGHIFPDQPARCIHQGLVPPMPIIIGNTLDETQQFINAAGPVTDTASLGAAVAKVFGSAAVEPILKRYPVADYPSPRAAFVKLTTDAQFTCQSRRVARLFASAQKTPVYRYLFRHVLENDPAQKALGAIHTIEHPFLFAWQGSYVPTATDLTIQQSMLGYWRQMAIAGNPNQAGLLPWPAAGESGDTYLDIGPTIAVGNGPANAQCDFWDTVPLPQPHI